MREQPKKEEALAYVKELAESVQLLAFAHLQPGKVERADMLKARKRAINVLKLLETPDETQARRKRRSLITEIALDLDCPLSSEDEAEQPCTLLDPCDDCRSKAQNILLRVAKWLHIEANGLAEGRTAEERAHRRPVAAGCRYAAKKLLSWAKE